MSQTESGFIAREVRIGTTRYPYAVWLPPGQGSGERLPVILFLHGAGERGSDGWRQTQVGLGSAIRWNPERFNDTIVVFAQAPEEQRWLDDPARAAMLAMDRTLAEFRADPNRVYLTGMSMGGYGTWFLATEYPDRWAALAPVCGGILPPKQQTSVRQLPRTVGSANPYATAAEAVPRVPIWIFHGADDSVIPAEESRRMAEELRARGHDVRYTEYPGAGHNSWDAAYGDAELWQWMLRQKRSGSRN